MIRLYVYSSDQNPYERRIPFEPTGINGRCRGCPADRNVFINFIVMSVFV